MPSAYGSASERPGSARWSRWIDLEGPVHYLDFGGPPGGPVVVALHGLGGSALNWLAIAPLLTRGCRLLAPDLAGHGLTQAHGRPATVQANRLLVHRFIDSVAGSPVILMGNSMGGMIAMLQAGTQPESTAGLVLLDAASPFVPALPDPVVAAVFALYAVPGAGKVMMARRRALAPETAMDMVLRLCCADPSRVAPHVVAEHVELLRRRAEFQHAEQDFLQAARSVVATAGGRPGSAYRKAIQAIGAPALLVHGDRDRLVPVAASRALVRRHASWQLVVLPQVGHIPQLEAPAETAAAILRWFGAAGSVLRAATHPLATHV